MNRLASKHGWVMALGALLLALLAIAKIFQRDFGVSGLDSLARAALPYAFATAGMAIVVIAGGIELSIAAIMAVISVTAAAMMANASDAEAALVVVFVLLLGLAMGALNGTLIVITRVPDIVVTLAMLFVWQGVALLILNAPGGGAAPWLRNVIVGGTAIPFIPPMLTTWLPKAALLLVILFAVTWIPIRRSKLGLMVYTIGSNKVAAFRSGVPVGPVRVTAYALAGLFAALGGLCVTLSTGIGEPIPGPYLLPSVAAVVLGGVVLGGGRGGLLGPVLAVFILRLVRLDLTLLAVDPNVTVIIEGTIMVVVVMIGALLNKKAAGS